MRKRALILILTVLSAGAIAVGCGSTSSTTTSTPTSHPTPIEQTTQQTIHLTSKQAVDAMIVVQPNLLHMFKTAYDLGKSVGLSDAQIEASFMSGYGTESKGPGFPNGHQIYRELVNRIA